MSIVVSYNVRRYHKSDKKLFYFYDLDAFRYKFYYLPFLYTVNMSLYKMINQEKSCTTHTNKLKEMCKGYLIYNQLI